MSDLIVGDMVTCFFEGAMSRHRITEVAIETRDGKPTYSYRLDPPFPNWEQDLFHRRWLLTDREVELIPDSIMSDEFEPYQTRDYKISELIDRIESDLSELKELLLRS